MIIDIIGRKVYIIFAFCFCDFKIENMRTPKMLENLTVLLPTIELYVIIPV